MFGIKKLKAELEDTKAKLRNANSMINALQQGRYALAIDSANKELINCKEELSALYEAAHARQKSPDAKPSEYMKGIEASMITIENHIRRG